LRWGRIFFLGGEQVEDGKKRLKSLDWRFEEGIPDGFRIHAGRLAIGKDSNLDPLPRVSTPGRPRREATPQ
jgi:hypothetical protein